ncbi:MAG: HEAT repeat domain-containing protein [Nitrospiria bacterium]
MESEQGSSQLIDPEALIGVLFEMQIGIRKLSIYPPTHPVIPKIIDNISKRFSALFEFVDAISLGIAKDEILYEGTSVSHANPVIKELAKMLHRLNLIGITFSQNLGEEEILKFLKMIADARSPLQSDREKIISDFREKAVAISLAFVSFKGAIQGGAAAYGVGEESLGKDVWKDLVSQLTHDLSKGDTLEGMENPGYTFDPAEVAKVINHFKDRQGPEKEKAYEGVIVDYLQEHASQSMASQAQTLRMKQEIGKLFSNLRPDVREEIFRFSLNQIKGEHSAMEGLVENLPSAVLPEVLNQIQLSDETVSTPTFSLLKKLVSLSDANTSLHDQLETKIQGHQTLFNELFLDKAQSTYYPEQYRGLLDHDLTPEQETEDNPQAQIASDPAETNHHLALILLDLLEGPFYGEDYYTTCVDYIMRLLTEGIGAHTEKIAIETIQILLRRLTSNPDTRQDFFREQLMAFLKPEIVSLLLKTPLENPDENEADVLVRIFDVVGDAFIPVLLDLLEVEEDMSVRKHIIRQVEKCGQAAIPFVLKNLDSDKWYVVRNMLVLLRTLQAQEALPKIVETMDHDSARVRLAALQAIGSIAEHTEPFFRSLEKALKDDDMKVYRAAVSTLVSMNHPQAIRLILTKLKGGKEGEDAHERRLHIVRTIGSAGSASWISALAKFRKGTLGYLWYWLFHRSLLKEVETALLKIERRERIHTTKPQPKMAIQEGKGEHDESG